MSQSIIHWDPYLGCILDQRMSGKPMAYKTKTKINSRVNFLFRKKYFLAPGLKPGHALIQPDFDYAYSTCYLAKKAKAKSKTQATQNKCVHFYHSLDEMIHISQNKFENLNYLPINIKINQ